MLYISRIIYTAFILTGLLTLTTQTSQAQVVPPAGGGVLTNPLDSAPRTFTISEITVTGAETRSETMIVATSGLDVGSSVTVPGPDLGEAIKRLHRTGLFSDVQIYQLSRSGGQIHLEIEVREQPLSLIHI